MSWVGFWDKIADDNYKKYHLKNMQTFIKKSRKIMDYNKNDKILDVGCGAGYLQQLLKDKTREIYGLDTSKRYIEMCKANFKNAPNLKFFQINPDNYTNFSFLGKKKFSKIICSSVVQYYNSVNDIRNLITECKKHALTNCRLIITDLIVNPKLIPDLIGIIKSSIKDGYLTSLLSVLLSAKTIRYYNFLSRENLLLMSADDIDEIAKEFNAGIYKGMTVHSNRLNMVIKF